MILRDTPRSTPPVCCECCELEATGPRPRAQSHLVPGDSCHQSSCGCRDPDDAIRIWCPSQLPSIRELRLQTTRHQYWMKDATVFSSQLSEIANNIHDSCCTILLLKCSLTRKFMRIFTRNRTFDSDNQKQWHTQYCVQYKHTFFSSSARVKKLHLQVLQVVFLSYLRSVTMKSFISIVLSCEKCSSFEQWSSLNKQTWNTETETLVQKNSFRLLLFFCENTFTIVFTVFLISCSALNGKNDIIVECGVCLR